MLESHHRRHSRRHWNSPAPDRLAVAAASGLAASGLFAGQPTGFVDTIVALAMATDAAARGSV